MQDFETVYCFEPNPVFIECWHKNIPADKNAILHEVGLGDKESTDNFALPLDQQLQRKPGSIKIKTLDSYELNNIDFIKIDVEHYEWFALQGANETIEAYHPIIMMEVKKDNPYRNQIMKFMKVRNYEHEPVGEMDFVFK